MEDKPESKTYRGSCHCGNYVFEAQLPEVKSAEHCNCSICHKKGVLWAFPDRGSFKFVQGEEETLTHYTFGRKLLDHMFCGNCGTSLFGRGFVKPPQPGEEPEFGVNVRTIPDVDIWSLQLRELDGKALPPAYEPPAYTGPEPQAQVENGKLYTGSCHCGAVTLALKSKPLDGTYDGTACECNCSICGRYGAAWIYPERDQVVVQGGDRLKYYFMGHRIFGKGFCTVCGVPVDNNCPTLSKEKEAELPEGVRKWYDLGQAKWPVNAKVLNGIDITKMKFQHIDGRSR